MSLKIQGYSFNSYKSVFSCFIAIFFKLNYTSSINGNIKQIQHTILNIRFLIPLYIQIHIHIYHKYFTVFLKTGFFIEGIELVPILLNCISNHILFIHNHSNLHFLKSLLEKKITELVQNTQMSTFLSCI